MTRARVGAARQPVVVDLDSCLADTRGRRHLCPTVDPARSWADFYAAAAADAPIPGTVTLVRLLHAAGHPVHILTWRPGTVMNLTVGWLSRHQVPHQVLQMRPADLPGDDSTGWKVRYVRRLVNSDTPPVLVVEDWPDVAEAVQTQLGVPVLCVNPRYATPAPAATPVPAGRP